MYELKTLSREAIPLALEMAQRYRHLNDPYEAESICLDILDVEPDNQDALVTLLLALTDSFAHELNPTFSRALKLLDRLKDGYCKAYYSGIIYERRAKVHLARHQPGSGEVAHEWFRKAMASYDQALNHCSPGNQDAILRWNTCVRILNANPHVKPAEGDAPVEMLDSWD